MELLILLLLGFLLFWALSGRSKNPNESDLEKRNLEWAQFIASYKKQAKTKQEKDLIKKMLFDIKNSGLPVDISDIVDNGEERILRQDLDLKSEEKAVGGESEHSSSIKEFRYIEDAELQPDVPLKASSDTIVGTVIQTKEPSGAADNSKINDQQYKYDKDEDVEVQTGINIDIDGPSILLYFGAFLFIASAGLFVAFGNVSGYLKTVLVLIIVAVLYGLGLWLFKNQPKFSQVGTTFTGISLAIAPLVGLAAYRYIFNESSGDIVWFTTSLFCLLFYMHALITLKKPLINYVFIFTFLSLFESSVSIIDAPIYYYGWGLSLVGIITLVLTKIKILDESFKEASKTTSVFFIPLAVIISIAMISTQGVLQLSVSLALATLYYLVQSFIEEDPIYKSNYLAISHALGLSTVGTFAYSINQKLTDVALALLIANTLQLAFALVYKINEKYLSNYLGTLVVSSMLTFVFALQLPSLALLALATFIAICFSLWLEYKQSLLYGLGFIAIPLLPVYYSYFVASTSLGYASLALALFAAVIVMQLIHLFAQDKISPELEYLSQYLTWFVSLAVILLSFASGQIITTLLLTYSIIATNIFISIYYKSKMYSVAANFILFMSSLLSLFMAIEIPIIITINIFTFALINFFIWLKFQENAAFHLGFISIPLIPLYIVFYMLDPLPSMLYVSYGMVLALIVMYAVYFFAQKLLVEQSITLAKAMLIVVSVAAILFSFKESSAISVSLVVYAVAIFSLVFGLINKDKDFLVATSVWLFLPFIRFISGGEDMYIIVFNIIAFILINFYIWKKYLDEAAFNVGFLAVPFAAIYISYVISDPPLLPEQVAYNLMLSLVAMLGVHYFVDKRLSEGSQFFVKTIILLISFVIILFSFNADSAVNTLLISYIVLALMMLFGSLLKEKSFTLAGSILVSLPILNFIGTGDKLFYATLIALIFNIIGAIFYRHELYRWVGSILWFVFPLVMNNALTLGWAANEFCAAFMIVTIGYLIARSIARGVAFTSSKIPLLAYNRNQSLSYVFGYSLSLIVAAGYSLVSPDAQIASSIAFSLIIVVVFLLAKYIEKNGFLYILLPILIQILLLTSLRPTQLNGLLNIYAAASIATAVGSYYLGKIAPTAEKYRSVYLEIAFLSAYTVPILSLSYAYSWMAPFTLTLAGVLTIYHFWKDGMAAREIGGVVVGVSIIWALYYFGIREFQAFTHVVAAQLAIYAYFRHKVGQKDLSEQYIILALATATIPLIIQAISNESGGLYGWWLLLEQVAFMLIGMSVKSKLMTFWGLYVSIGAVLYQLRNLGWAALTLLAMVIIGIAIYKISKNNDTNN